MSLPDFLYSWRVHISLADVLPAAVSSKGLFTHGQGLFKTRARPDNSSHRRAPSTARHGHEASSMLNLCGNIKRVLVEAHTHVHTHAFTHTRTHAGTHRHTRIHTCTYTPAHTHMPSTRTHPPTQIPSTCALSEHVRSLTAACACTLVLQSSPVQARACKHALIYKPPGSL